MKRQKSSNVLFIGGVIVVIVLAVVMLVGRNRMGGESGKDLNAGTVDTNKTIVPKDEVSIETAPRNDLEEDTSDSNDTVAVTLKDVIDLAQAWMPCDIHKDWIGKPAPDFTVTDIDGKQQQLSSYRGKPVIVALWAQWFKPSTDELKTLVELKKTLGDQVVIFGLSFDAEANIKRYLVEQPGINFPIICGLTQSLPAPYSVGKPMPCAMIIAPDGTLKISVRGTVPLDDYHALLAAK